MTHYTPYESFADEANDYLDQHNIYDLFGNIMKQLAIHRPEDPHSMIMDMLMQPTSVLKIIIVGPPGAGSTTHAERLAEEYQIIRVHIESLVREEIANKTSVGEKLEKLQEKEIPFPDDLLISVLGARINQSDCLKQGWVIDGFPQTLAQARLLQSSKFNILCNKFIVLECSDANAKIRLNKAGRTQHLSDDDVDTMFTNYHRNIKQFINLFSESQKAINTDVSIDSRGPNEAWQKMKAFVDMIPPSKAPRRPMRVCVLGKTGAGKATQCRMLSNKYGQVHVSTGDLLRREIAKGPAARAQLEPLITSGVLVPDEIVIPLVCQRLLEADCRPRGWLLEGFPRTIAQAKALAAHKLVPNRCVFLDVDDSTARSRVRTRLLDPATGDFYNSNHFVPTSLKLVTQAKDQEHVLDNLLNCYTASQEDLASFYANVSTRVQGELSREEVFARIETFLNASLGAIQGR